ncbi:hypothetical protein M3Y94_00236300 [Aphelenchoides besseyi]|nr:hypothetical protein M3Y94_00236300 [Aphelenchoides besseyi]
MLQFNFVRIWKFICCSSTISEQNELEIERQKAKAKDTQEFHKYNKEYLSCCGLVHVRGLTKGIIFAKTFFFASLLLSSLSMNISPLVHFGNLWIGTDELRNSTVGISITQQSLWSIYSSTSWILQTLATRCHPKEFRRS